MRWETKAAIQAVLSRTPFGASIHRKLQDVAGTVRFDPDPNYSRRANFLSEFKTQDLPIEGKSFVEIGTGWHPMLPLLLHILGASRVTTVDLNRWMTRGSLRETIEGIRAVSERFVAEFGASRDRCDAVVSRLLALCDDKATSVDEILRAAGVAYQAPGNAAETGLPGGSVDYVVSTNVLEHVPPGVIDAIFRESVRILKPGGYMLHHIDPGDHFAYDTRITTINFLRYSPRVWYFIGGSGLAYHNRLRCVDYDRMIESAGFEIAHRRARTDERALEELRSGRLRVHEKYAGYTAEELCEAHVTVLAQRPVQAGALSMAADEPLAAAGGE